MGLKLANNATSTLASSITNSATSVSIQTADASKFPSLSAGDWFPVTVVDAAGNMEVMRVTARSSGTLTVTRGQEGTSGLAFAAGSRVDLRVTSAALAALETPDAINGATAKATPVDADSFGYRNSSGGGFVSLTWANIKAALWTAWGGLTAAGTAKTTPVDADTFALADSAASNATKKTTWANLKAAMWTALGALIAGGTDKATPVDADMLALADSAATNASKKLTWANVKATLLAYFVTKFPRVDGAQSFNALEMGQARANIDGGVLAGLRNKLINGDMLVSQRGTSFSVPAGGALYTADRWVVANGTNQTATVTVFPRSLAAFAGQGHPGYIGISFAVAPTTGTVELRQPVEGVQTLAGKTVTLGARAARSAGSVAVSGILYQNFGTGGSPSALVTTAVTFIDPNAVVSGVDLKGVVTLPSVAGKSLGTLNNDYLSVSFSFAPRDGAATYFTHAYLVEGDATTEADPFSARQYQQELALCQRYYETGQYVFVGYQSAGSGYGNVQTFSCAKRRFPTMSNTVGAATNVVSTTLAASGTVGFLNNATASALGTVVHTGTYFADAEF